jgi:hypothetical protein
MAKKNYRKLEDRVINLFKKGTTFTWDGVQYKVLKSDKPQSQSKGEPKTDVFVEFENNNTNEIKQLKISCKLEGTNEFQENKITAERAEQIFGKNWANVIIDASQSIKEKFEHTQVYFSNGSGRTKETQYTNGWKVEIASKQRELSVPLPLSDDEIRNYIYKGTTLDDKKKDSKVKGEIVKDSGIAEYMLVSAIEELNSIDSVLQKIIPIDDYPIQQHYIIFTGNNFRVLKKKWDGNRALGVQVKWVADLDEGEMVSEIIYDHPLDPAYSAPEMSKKTLAELNKFGDQIFNDMK